MRYFIRDYELSTDTQQLIHNGCNQKVEPLVFRLLVYMIENSGRILSHDELIGKLWKSPEISSSALFAAISAARHAIGDTGKKQECIKTVSGAGYRFVGAFESAGGIQESVAVPKNTHASLKTHEHASVSESNRPSIAVLPFANMSGDPEQEYFANGLTEDVITNLSRFSILFVIARYSTLKYKNSEATSQEIGKDLGVRYLLIGSTQRDRETVRITVRLVDATNDHSLWSERYDRNLNDIFLIRDEVAQTIAATLMGDTGRVLRAEIVRAGFKDSASLDAHDYTLHARHHLNEHTKSSTTSALALLKQAIALDPSYALANENIAWVHLHRLFKGWSKDFDQDLGMAFHWAQKAKTLDDGACGVHRALGEIYLYQREYEKSKAAFDRALELNPNSPELILDIACTSVYLGRLEEAVAGIKRAMCLNPYYPQWFTEELGWAHAFAGSHNQAIQVLKALEFPTNSSASC